jgi:hypothetical protein
MAFSGRREDDPLARRTGSVLCGSAPLWNSGRRNRSRNNDDPNRPQDREEGDLVNDPLFAQARGPEQVERIVETLVAAQQLELPLPERLAAGNDHVIAVEGGVQATARRRAAGGPGDDGPAVPLSLAGQHPRAADRPVVGYGDKTVNTLRLWAAAAQPTEPVLLDAMEEG